MQELVNGKSDGPVLRADVAAVTRALAAPFDAREVKFKPAVVTTSFCPTARWCAACGCGWATSG
jgi:hypothetical protein